MDQNGPKQSKQSKMVQNGFPHNKFNVTTYKPNWFLLLLFNHTKKNLNLFSFLLQVWTWLLLWTQLWLWLWLKLHHFYLDKVCTLTLVREYRKIPASVLGVPSGCALGISLNLMLVFLCTPLLSSRYRLSTVKQRSVQ